MALQSNMHTEGPQALPLLFVLPSIGKGGAERQLLLLLEGLRQRYQVFLLVFRSNVDYPLPLGITPIYLHKKRKVDVGFILRFAAVVKNIRPSVIVSGLMGSNPYCQVLGAIYSTPVITAMRIAGVMWHYRIVRILEFLFPCSHMIANSERARCELVEHAHMPIGKVSTIHNGVDTTRFHPIEEPQIDETMAGPTSEDVFRLLFVGRISPQKNLEAVLRGLADANIGKLRFYIVGRPFDEAYYLQCRELAAQILPENCVCWAGEKSAIEHYYSWADALILPSWFEGCPNVVLEAMACGRPILVSETADTESIVEEPVNGYRFDPNDPSAIAKKVTTLMHQDLSRYVKPNRSKVVERYSVNGLVNRTTNVIEGARRAFGQPFFTKSGGDPC